MSSEDAAEISADARDWRPLAAKPAARPPQITDPIIEPLWQGTRVLVHFKATPDGPRRGRVELRDAEGLDVSRDFAGIVDALADAVYANDAVIDGIITDQGLAGGLGIGVVPRAEMSSVGLFLGRLGELTVGPVSGRKSGTEVGFIALDLLSVDGQHLFDVPLLERKRLLDGLIEGNEYARVSPFVRPPIAQWLNSWKSAGFRGVVLKAANSRYRPADVAMGWAIIERVGQR